jgi:serine/threonine protein kinase
MKWCTQVLEEYRKANDLIEVEEILYGDDVPDSTSSPSSSLSHKLPLDDFYFEEEVQGQGDHTGCISCIPGVLSSIVFSVDTDVFTPISMLANRAGRKVYLGHENQVLVVGHNQFLAVTDDEQYTVPREVQLLQRLLGLPHIMELHAFLTLNQSEYFAYLTPYYRGVNAVNAINGNLYLISKFMTQLMCAVKDMHERGVVHRDLCFDNVVWDPITEHLTVIDFDLAAPIRSEGYYARTGRDDFDAPEKTKAMDYFASKNWNAENPTVVSYTEVVDEYACGVMMWMLLNETTDSPSPRTIKTWYQKIQRKKKDKSLPEIHFTMGLLATLPENRTTAAAALVHPFLTDTEPNETYLNYKQTLEALYRSVKVERDSEEDVPGLLGDEDPKDDEEDPEDDEEDPELLDDDDDDEENPEDDDENPELLDDDDDESSDEDDCIDPDTLFDDGEDDEEDGSLVIEEVECNEVDQSEVEQSEVEPEQTEQNKDEPQDQQTNTDAPSATTDTPSTTAFSDLLCNE